MPKANAFSAENIAANSNRRSSTATAFSREPSIPNNTPTSGLRAAKAVARDEGVSDVTIWRRVKLGMLTAVNIAGRPYITTESLANFYRRATAGEFAKPPAGAARKSAEARRAKEAGTQ